MNTHAYMKDIVVTVFEEMIFGYDDTHFDEIRQWLLTLRGVQRPYFLHTNVVAETYWEPLNQSETLFDFVVRGSILFQTLLESRNGGITLVGWRQTLADSISSLYATRTQRLQIVSNVVAEKLPASDYIRGLLQTETWLVWVLTLDLFLSHLPLGTLPHANTSA